MGKGNIMNLRHVLNIALATAALAMAGAGACWAGEPVLHAIAVKGSIGPITDLSADFWKQAPAVKVATQPQNVAEPQNTAPAIGELSVRAVHNGEWLAFLIEWADPTKSDRIVVDQFGDQVAVEMPVTYKEGETPNPMMGAPGERVNIMQWRAAFQHDIDTGTLDGPKPQDLYPNMHTDVYPDQVLSATDARPYMGAVGVDNPVSRPLHSPVLEQMAEGFGSLTVVPEQHASGKGVWAAGRWRVVITRPLAAGDAYSPSLRPGSNTLAAFAVWDGGSKEVGSRKAWANWVELKLDPVKP
jgi:hypothetical protein